LVARLEGGDKGLRVKSFFTVAGRSISSREAKNQAARRAKTFLKIRSELRLQTVKKFPSLKNEGRTGLRLCGQKFHLQGRREKVRCAVFMDGRQEGPGGRGKKRKGYCSIDGE